MTTINFFLVELNLGIEGAEACPIPHEWRPSVKPTAPSSIPAELFFFYSTVINRLFWLTASLLFKGAERFFELDAIYCSA
jgi:hypothetical protein